MPSDRNQPLRRLPRRHRAPAFRRVTDPRPYTDPPPRQCAHCGAWLPRDCGAWVVGLDAGGRVALMCSRECDQQASGGESEVRHAG